MSSRPRRTAAARAKQTISVHAQWANSSDKDLTPTGTITTTAPMSSRRSNRTSGPSIDVRADSYLDDEDEPMPASAKQRQAARGANRGRPDPFEGGEIIHGKRDRGGKKSYVIESSPDNDDDDEEDEEAQIEVDDDDEDMEDAEGEEDMDMDAEGDVEMVIPASSAGPTIKISRAVVKPPVSRNDNEDEDEEDDDDDDLSDPGDSDAGDQTLGFGDETGLGDDEDAEGDEIEVAGELGGGAGAVDSDDEGSQDGELDLDLGKMTKRQRARFEDGPQDFMKLSDGGSNL